MNRLVVLHVRVTLVAALLLAGGAGCSSPQLRGVVVEGQTPAVVAVSANDPRLGEGGISGAVIEFTLDPSSLRPRTLGGVVTDAQGQFELPIDAFGAGVLEYELGVLSRANGYRSVYQTMPMPSGRKRLIIVMVPGVDTQPVRRDFLEETLELGERLQGQ